MVCHVLLCILYVVWWFPWSTLKYGGKNINHAQNTQLKNHLFMERIVIFVNSVSRTLIDINTKHAEPCLSPLRHTLAVNMTTVRTKYRCSRQISAHHNVTRYSACTYAQISGFTLRSLLKMEKIECHCFLCQVDGCTIVEISGCSIFVSHETSLSP